MEFWKQDGSLTDNLIYQIRQDGESRWLFVAHGKEPAYRDVSIGEKITLAVKGNWTLTLYNTLDGTIQPLNSELRGGRTETAVTLFNHDSLLLKLSPRQAEPSEVTGWFTDRSIQTVPLGRLQKGSNILELAIPFGKRSNLEWCYLLGDFGVRVRGAEVTVTEPVHELGFGDVTSQGLPFYGGNIRYRIPAPAGETVEVQILHI